MTTILDSEIAAEIYSGMSDLFFDAILERRTRAAGANEWTPGAAVVVSVPCKAIQEAYSVSTMASGLVEASDCKVLVLAHKLTVAPEPLDRITIRGETFTIVPVTAGRPPVLIDPARAVWECRAKKV